MADVSGITSATNWLNTQQPQDNPMLSNPLQAMSTMQSIANARSQNQLLQQELLNKQQELSNQVTAGAKSQMDLHVARMNRVNQVAFGLYNKYTNGLNDGGQSIRDAAAAELKEGTITSDEYDAIVKKYPEGSSTADIVPKLASGVYTTLTGDDAIRNATPLVDTISIGGQEVQRRRPSPLELLNNPNAQVSYDTGHGIIKSAIGRTPGPDDFVTVTDNNPTLNDGKTPNPRFGTSYQIQAGELLKMQGRPTSPATTNPTQPGATPTSPAATPMQPGATPTSPAATPMQPGAAPASPAATPMQPGAAPSRLPLEGASTVAPNVAQAAKDSETLYEERQTQAGNYQARTFPLERAIDIWQSPNAPTTGPLSDAVNAGKSFLLNQSPEVFKKLGWTKAQIEQTDDFQVLKKYLTQYLNMQDMSGGTNLQLLSAMHGSPMTSMNDGSGLEVAKTALAMERMNAALVTKYQQMYPGLGQGTFFKQWMAQQMQQIDPRGFANDLLSEKRFAKMWSGMNQTQRDRYRYTVNTFAKPFTTRSVPADEADD